MASEQVTVTPGPPAAEVVEIWTDGGCKPNPGPGGWAAILRFRGVERELSGAEPATTNNRMELTAAAMALEALKRPCRVVLHTDSQYVQNGVTRWHEGWVRRNWRNAAGDPVANMELWRRLLDAAKSHRIEWRWVRGHSGNPMNAWTGWRRQRGIRGSVVGPLPPTPSRKARGRTDARLADYLRQQTGQALTYLAKRLIPVEQSEAIELGNKGAVRQHERRTAHQSVRRWHLCWHPHEQREVLVAQIGVHAERTQFGLGHNKSGLLRQLAHGRRGMRLIGFGQSLGNVPARRTRGVAEQDAFPIRDDHATR
jgi:ribonuclease HI